MNGGSHASGCAGAVNVSGRPYRLYCDGEMRNGQYRFPWWRDCCHWNGSHCRHRGPEYSAPTAAPTREDRGTARCSPGEYSNGEAVCTQCPPGTYSGSSATSCDACPDGQISAIGAASVDACFSKFTVLEPTTDGFCTGKGPFGDRELEMGLISSAADCQLFARAMYQPSTGDSYVFNATNDRCTQASRCAHFLPGACNSADNGDVRGDCPALCGLCGVPQTPCVISSDSRTVRYFDPAANLNDPMRYAEASYTPICAAVICDRTGYAIDRPATRDAAPVCTNEAVLAEARETEAATYRLFYIIALVIVVFVEIAGFYVVLKTAPDEKLGWPQAILVLIFGIRSFDMFSDWAFAWISLKAGGSFAIIYADQGGDADAVWGAALAFCVFGTMLYIPDLWGFYKRVDPAAKPEASSRAASITVLVFLFEDMPQLVINGIYLDTVGFEDADNIAIFAFTMSMLSLVLNILLFCDEKCDLGFLAKANPKAAARRREGVKVKSGVVNPVLQWSAAPPPPSYTSSTRKSMTNNPVYLPESSAAVSGYLQVEGTSAEGKCNPQGAAPAVEIYSTIELGLCSYVGRKACGAKVADGSLYCPVHLCPECKVNCKPSTQTGACSACTG